jgi:hypothetical protein
MLTNVRLCIGLSTGGKIRYGDLITALSLAESATLTELSARISVGLVGNPHLTQSRLGYWHGPPPKPLEGVEV